MTAGGRTFRRAWTGLVIAGIAAGGAWAQQVERFVREPPRGPSPLPTAEELAHVTIDPALADMAAPLDDDSYEKRQEATVALRDSPFGNLELYALLDRAPLTDEQRHRVLLVIAERLLTRPRGAVGIQIDQRRLPEVVVFKLLPELPAREVMEIGDRITHLDGVPVANWDTFRLTVQSRVPGTKISIRVERPAGGEGPAAVAGEVLDVELVLGSAELLRDPNTGLPQSDGTILALARREAQEAVERFGPEPRRIVLESGSEAFAETLPSPGRFQLQPELSEDIRGQNPGQ